MELLITTNEKGIASFGENEKRLFREMIAQYPKAVVSLKIEKFFDSRTTKQNRYYWFILSLVTFEVIKLGDKELKPLDMHIFFKQRFLPKKVVSITSVYGEVLESESIESSRNLDKNEFSDYIEKIKEFAQTYLGFEIPEPKSIKQKKVSNEYSN